MMQRCSWLKNAPEIYIKYHDEEWGIPVHDDNKLFEFLILECFQAGLSWLTVSKKRKHLYKAFDKFNYNKIANYSDEKILSLLQNNNIIRSKSKIKATINNAKIFQSIRAEFDSFNNYIWQFTNNKIIQNNIEPPPSQNKLSNIISKDLKKRGMKYVGPTIIYSYLQAIGIINDHEKSCIYYQKINNE